MAVDKVVVPGESGEYGITVGHSPIISQLQPGVVTVFHLSGESVKYFIPGGFAITHANSVTDISVPEAVNLADFEESTVKSSLSEATQAASSAPEGSIAKAQAQIEVNTLSAIARALNILV
eukprot:CAMPEP_0182427686 /NCGR_PEP_ID=MMETSP1167-20130531/18984_1 /TAXON_ID=2988 /ORGANISM="Mallomonas Sp, Strain CCMP3275" /LENGTH=120 /DNA_ID=CAMNT_0024610109 /DNA_START=188 /DNA_END=550 /DNA_ORIENTATION=-